MIRSFCDSRTESPFNDQDVPRFRAIERVARRKLLYLHRAQRLEDLRAPPGNRLEALRGDRKGQHSIRTTTNGGFASTGRTAMLSMLKSWTITEVRHGRQAQAT